MTLTLENPENNVISRVIFLSRIQFLRCYFMLVILLRAKWYQGKYPTGTGNIREISGKMILKNESPPWERTKTYRYLGLLVDEKFSWESHVSELCWKLSQMAGIILKIRSLLTKEAMLLVYHSLIGSKLRYGLVCWATANKTLLDKINVAHNTVITYLTFSKWCSRMWPLYCQLKVLPLDILIQIEQAKTMYKFEHKMLPQVFDNYFQKPTHCHNTRYASTHNNFPSSKDFISKRKITS